MPSLDEGGRLLALIRKAPLTVGLTLFVLAIYGFLGAGIFPVEQRLSMNVFANVFRHGNTMHLVFNLALFGCAGFIVEQSLGQARYALGLLLLAIIPTVVEYAIAGPNFLGMSGLAYGVGIYALYKSFKPRYWGVLSVCVVIFIIADSLFLNQSLAVFVHSTAIAMGGGFAMFGKLGRAKEPAMRSMQVKDINAVVNIIDQTDDDDALEARSSFERNGVENLYVLEIEGRIGGVCGYFFDGGAPDIAWLSWTYLDEALHGQGWGQFMLDTILGELAGHNIRKIFIDTSDYKEDGVLIYGNAHKLYESFGAKLEMTIKNYYDEDESRLVFGVKNPEASPQTNARGAPAGCRIIDITGAAETQDSASLVWEETPSGLSGMEEFKQKAIEGNARFVMINLPSDISMTIDTELKQFGFYLAGELPDYYSFGLHQHCWMCFNLN